MKLATWVIIFILSAIAVTSMVIGNPIAGFIQAVPPLVYFFKNKFPNNRVLCELTSPLSPVPKDGMRSSEYSARMAYYSSKWLAIFVLVWSLVVTFKINIEGNIFALIIFALAIPLFGGMALLATVFHTVKYLYIKVTGQERVWRDIE